MSNQVTEAFVEQFGTTFRHVAQQNKSRLESTVMVMPGIVGMSASINRLGARVASQRLVRHGDTPINDQPHSTRFVDLLDYEDGDMIDKQDKLRMLIDPTSDYLKAMVMAHNRKKDDVIVTALGGNSRSTTGNIALPAAQKIAVGGTGLTKAKIIQARVLFRTNEVDNHAGEELTMLYNAKAASDVLSDATLTSADFMASKFLESGDIVGNWLGFTWVPTERLPKVSTTRFLYAYAKSGATLGIGEEIVTEVGPDPGKGFNTRVYTRQSMGAVRTEEEKIVEIAILEP